MNRRRFTAEEKVRIVLMGLQMPRKVSELCRREGVNPNLFYRWKRQFIEAGRLGLAGNSTSPEIALRRENEELKAHIGSLYAQLAALKKMTTEGKR